MRAGGGSRRSGNGSSLEHRACAALAGLRTDSTPSKGCTSSRTPPTFLWREASVSFSCTDKKRRLSKQSLQSSKAVASRQPANLVLHSGSLRSPPWNTKSKKLPAPPGLLSNTCARREFGNMCCAHVRVVPLFCLAGLPWVPAPQHNSLSSAWRTTYRKAFVSYRAPESWRTWEVTRLGEEVKPFPAHEHGLPKSLFHPY